MHKQQLLLTITPTTAHRIEIIGETVGRQAAVLSQETAFELDTAAIDMLTWFLKAVKADEKVRHTFTEENWILDYDPEYGPGDLEAFRLRRRATGRTISMARPTAFKLLAALLGETERLVEDEG